MSNVQMLIVASSLIWGGVALANSDSEAATYWRSEDGATVVEFDRCGEEYCGRIVVILDDRISKSDRTALCGLQIIGALLPLDDGTWSGGWLLDPETEGVYKLTTRVDDATMTLRVFETIETWSVDIRWPQVERPATFCNNSTSNKSW